VRAIIDCPAFRSGRAPILSGWSPAWKLADTGFWEISVQGKSQPPQRQLGKTGNNIRSGDPAGTTANPSDRENPVFEELT
jgi:hypothetical protein